MKKSLPWILGAAFLAFAVWLLRYKVHFDWATFGREMRSASPLHIAIGVGVIYLAFLFRSWRWATFLRPGVVVPRFSLIGSQFIGFTAVALFGRLADLSRPYLVARRTSTPVATQVAVYTVERMFDLGAAAIVFSSAFAFAPKTLPHHELFVKVGIGSLTGTALLIVFAVAVRVAGVRIAGVVRRALSRVSEKLAASVAEKILAFRDGIGAISSFSEFLLCAALSLAMWTLIATAYVQCAHAFTAEPALANFSVAQAMLIMAVSIGGSLFSLPVLGWFTQIALLSISVHGFFGVPQEAATGYGALLLIVTFLSVIPGGLIYAQVESVSFKRLTEGSAEAEARA